MTQIKIVCPCAQSSEDGRVLWRPCRHWIIIMWFYWKFGLFMIYTKNIIFTYSVQSRTSAFSAFSQICPVVVVIYFVKFSTTNIKDTTYIFLLYPVTHCVPPQCLETTKPWRWFEDFKQCTCITVANISLINAQNLHTGSLAMYATHCP